MKTDELVSVIIPVYNVEKYLHEAIESIIRQTYTNIEIILIDDGSTDDSPHICDLYSKNNENIVVYHKKNGGSSSARNEGLKYISPKSSFILFFDSDDILYEDAISGMVKCAKKTNADIVIPDRYIRFNEQKSEIVKHFSKDMYTDNPKEFCAKVLINKGRAWRAHSLLYKSELIQKNKLKFIDGITSEDYFFNLDFLDIAHKIQIYEHATVKYRLRKGSISRSFQRNYEDTIWMIDEYASKFLKKYELDDNYRKSLLKRNIILYTSSIMSEKNTMTYQEKKKLATNLFKNPRSVAAFKVKTDFPYFNRGIIIFYFKLQYWLVKHKMFTIALKITELKDKL